MSCLITFTATLSLQLMISLMQQFQYGMQRLCIYTVAIPNDAMYISTPCMCVAIELVSLFHSNQMYMLMCVYMYVGI